MRIKSTGLFPVVPVLLGVVFSAWLMGHDSSSAAEKDESPRPIPFDSLGQGFTLAADVNEPAIFMAGGGADPWIVAVFRGMMGTGGYGIAIQQVTLASKTVQLTVTLTDPAPGQDVIEAQTFPHHVILIRAEDLTVPLGTVWAVVTTDGDLLAQTRYPCRQRCPRGPVSQGHG